MENSKKPTTPIASAITDCFSTASETGNAGKQNPNIVDALYFVGKAVSRNLNDISNSLSRLVVLVEKSAEQEEKQNKKG